MRLPQRNDHPSPHQALLVVGAFMWSLLGLASVLGAAYLLVFQSAYYRAAALGAIASFSCYRSLRNLYEAEPTPPQ